MYRLLFLVKRPIIVFFMLFFCGFLRIATAGMHTSYVEEGAPFVKKHKKIKVSVMQFNVWMQGTKVPKGVDLIVDEVLHYQPDFVTFSEDSKGLLEKICVELAKRGVVYYAKYDVAQGLLSKHPIQEYSVTGDLKSMHKIVANIDGQDFAVYSAHLNYTHYAEYLPRGYDGSGGNKKAPITDVQAILAEDAKSTRPQAIQAFIDGVSEDINKKRIIILAGDFNEASHLDWTAQTKDLYDRNGAVVPWPTSTKLYANSFKDSYRVVYPNELTHPGFTWVVASPWLKDADERDRIDFIYYYDSGNIKPISSYLIGPDKAYVGSTLVKDPGKDPILLPQSIWPSDHRALITKFRVTIPAK